MPELTQEQVKARAGVSRPQPGSGRALCPWVLAGRTSQRHSQLPVQGRPCYRRILPLSLAWQTGVQFLLCPAPSLVLRTMAPDTLAAHQLGTDRNLPPCLPASPVLHSPCGPLTGIWDIQI